MRHETLTHVSHCFNDLCATLVKSSSTHKTDDTSCNCLVSCFSCANNCLRLTASSSASTLQSSRCVASSTSSANCTPGFLVLAESRSLILVSCAQAALNPNYFTTGRCGMISTVFFLSQPRPAGTSTAKPMAVPPDDGDVWHACKRWSLRTSNKPLLLALHCDRIGQQLMLTRMTRSDSSALRSESHSLRCCV